MKRCIAFGRTKRKVCTKWTGGRKAPGKPGKRCTRFKTKTVKICRDFSRA